MLGKNPKLSIAEIKTVLEKKEIYKNQKIAIFETSKKLKQSFLNNLGGTQKIAQEINLEEIIIKFQKIKKNKKLFAMSKFYKESRGEKEKKIDLKKELIKTKKLFKEKEINSRFINKNFENLKTASYIKENLKEKGGEIIIFEDKLFLTIAIQDIDKYSKRDYDRPKRDPKRGMMPPKLAQILINLAEKKSNIIYDPFCGNGTILAEAILMNKKIIGSDIKKNAINDTKKNLEWLKTNFLHTSGDTFLETYKIFIQDSTEEIKEKIEFDAICTEGFLGKARNSFPKPKELEKEIKIINKIYTSFLKNISKYIKKDNFIILTIPFFKKQDQVFTIKNFFLDKLFEQFKIFDFEEWEYVKNIKKIIRGKTTMFYSRKNQIVGREIIKLKKD